MEIDLKYGSGRCVLAVPEARVAWYRGIDRLPGHADAVRGDPAGFDAAVARLGAAGAAEAWRGKRVGLLVADGTREWSPEALVAPLGPLLRGASELLAFLCTGTHDPESAANRRLAARLGAALAGAGIQGAAPRIHDCRRAPFVHLGRTARGTPVEVDERIQTCDALLVLAEMKHHYFAGYSNPVKYVLPGIASLEAARSNHSLALEEEATSGRHPWHPDPSLRSNPLAADMVEAFDTVVAGRPCFALVWIGGGAGVRWADGGPVAEVAARGMEAVDRVASLEVEPVRRLVVSPGGAPHDESLYTAQRALELSRAAVLPGGEVLFLARCEEGIGPPAARENFFEPLQRPLAEIVAPARADYAMYAHKPVKFARYIESLAALHLVSALPAGEVERAHMRPASSAQAVVDRWLAEDAPGGIGFLDDASRLSIRSRSRST